VKHAGTSLIVDARTGLRGLSDGLGEWRSDESWRARASEGRGRWLAVVEDATSPAEGLPTDAQVLGAVARASAADDVVVCAAGGLPGELHKLWKASGPGGYHVEYGFSCMGYEIAGGLGVKMAAPEREVWVVVGDGSYLMLNSEIATSVELGLKLNIVVLDNRGFGCISRLQVSTGAAPFNNLFAEGTRGEMPTIDFAAHARSLGAVAVHVSSPDELEAALVASRASSTTSVVVIDTDSKRGTDEGGSWWDVPVAEVSERSEVRAARTAYDDSKRRR